MITNFNKKEKAIMNQDIRLSSTPLERDHGDLRSINENGEINEWLWVTTSGKMIEIEPPQSPIRMVGKVYKTFDNDL